MKTKGLDAFDPEVVLHLSPPWERAPEQAGAPPRVQVAPNPRLRTVDPSLTMVKKGDAQGVPTSCEVLFQLPPNPSAAGEFVVDSIGEPPGNYPVMVQSIIILDESGAARNAELWVGGNHAGSWVLLALSTTATETGKFVIPLAISIPASTSIHVVLGGVGAAAAAAAAAAATPSAWASCIYQAPFRMPCARSTRLRWESRYVTHAVGSIAESQMAISVLGDEEAGGALYLEGPHWKGSTVIPTAALSGGKLVFGSAEVIGFGLKGPARARFSDGTPAVFEVVAELVCSAVFSPEDNTEDSVLVDALKI